MEGDLMSVHKFDVTDRDRLLSQIADLQCECDRLRNEVASESIAHIHTTQQRDELLAACRIGLAWTIACGGRAEAAGETVIAAESVMHTELIRTAIQRASDL
jgi:hypothetical protein